MQQLLLLVASHIPQNYHKLFGFALDLGSSAPYFKALQRPPRRDESNWPRLFKPQSGAKVSQHGHTEEKLAMFSFGTMTVMSPGLLMSKEKTYVICKKLSVSPQNSIISLLFVASSKNVGF